MIIETIKHKGQMIHGHYAEHTKKFIQAEFYNDGKYSWIFNEAEYNSIVDKIASSMGDYFNYEFM